MSCGIQGDTNRNLASRHLYPFQHLNDWGTPFELRAEEAGWHALCNAVESDAADEVLRGGGIDYHSADRRDTPKQVLKK
ncbi:MAG: hypothetical protein U0892_21120 [Pirellulales bacterium]